MARRRGRPPGPVDLTDIDDVAVERAVRGQPVTLNRGERIAAVRELTARGHTRPAIAERVGYTLRTVARDRAFTAPRHVLVGDWPCGYDTGVDDAMSPHRSGVGPMRVEELCTSCDGPVSTTGECRCSE